MSKYYISWDISTWPEIKCNIHADTMHDAINDYFITIGKNHTEDSIKDVIFGKKWLAL